MAIIDSMDMSLSKFHGRVKDREAWRAAVPGVTESHNDLASEKQHCNGRRVPLTSKKPHRQKRCILLTGERVRREQERI